MRGFVSKVVWIVGLCSVLAGAPGPLRAAPATPNSATEVRPLLIGASPGAATLRAADGSEVELEAALGGKPTVLIFYRGGW